MAEMHTKLHLARVRNPPRRARDTPKKRKSIVSRINEVSRSLGHTDGQRAWTKSQ